ncbi:MAG: GGDEF domain-containing protein [Treponema sp.]|nr:GGDEF domain-containing protein [Treponema sp.]
MSDNYRTDSLSAETVSQYEKKIYDLEQLLEICRSLCSTIEFSTLIESILYTCMGQMHVLGAGVFILEALDSNILLLDNNYNGMDLDPNITYQISISHPLVSVISKNNTVYTKDELIRALPEGTDLKMITSLHPSLIVPLMHRNRLTGILLLGDRLMMNEETRFTAYEKEQILAISSLAAIAINNAALVERSSTDMMTHLKLKYFFMQVLGDKLDTALTQESPVAVIMLDIDFFKRFNDTYGHACGDYVLQTVAKIMRSAIRSEDLAARYGGEEFTLMLHNTGKEDAITVADRIRTKIEQYDFCYENLHVQVTISVGVAEFNPKTNPTTSPRALIDQADQALYISKRNGRNRVTFADSKIISEVKLPE